MNNHDLLVSLDIGTSKVRVIIGEVHNGSINIIGVGTAESQGINKGAIVDIDQTVLAIREAVDQAERMVDVTIQDVFVGISGNHIELVMSQGVVAVSSENKEIGEEDIYRVTEAAKVISIPPEKEIIDVVPIEYIIDGLSGVSDPRGMIGIRLEMEGTIITGSKTIIHNLYRCVERAGLKIAGFYLQSLAASDIALSKDEKNLGVVLIDMGAGSTTVSIFEQGTLAGIRSIPIGGDYITSDIAYALRTSTEEARRLQMKYGCGMIEQASPSESFKVKRIGSNSDLECSQIDLAHVIEPRVAEIFEMIQAEVIDLGYHGEIPAGYVLTGGVAAMPGVVELAREELQAPARVAMPDYIGVRDPAFTTGVGLIKYASRHTAPREPMVIEKEAVLVSSKPAVKSQTKSRNKSEGMIDRVKNWFSEFI
ncbi:cell division protein FtsA [Ammoniphilus oxalaticus]|uniref:Cell division protein FtsA n=1 Tax=Ammoniphilus oxalaticus TaxID=66863 RepID=A0A419SJF4_9BACL|nr:cell division protein FtsA [Ammoniphilus oxalaticus]RKD24107.1 cell division protein FtsA [Ammoniphilus oxalaticus]